LIEVKVDKDVREYQEKTLLNLTARQLVCGIIALAVSGYLFYTAVIGPQFFQKPDPNSKITAEQQLKQQEDNTEMISWVVILVVLPIVFVGFFRYNGMTVEKFAFCFVKDKVLPKRRVYKPKNEVHAAIKKVLVQEKPVKQKKGQKVKGGETDG